MNAQTKVMTVGYQGFGNVGDEAILTGIERLLAGLPIQVSAVACGDTAPVAAFPAAPRVSLPRFVPNRSFLRRLRQTDVLLVAGGGVINDYWASLIPRYLLWVLLARLFGARVIWVGVGIGPVRRRAWRYFVRLMLRASTLVMVRDPGSGKLVREVAGRSALLIPDPAYFNNRPTASRPSAGLGIVLRGPAPGEEARLSKLAGAIADLIAQHADEAGPCLLSMHAAADASTLAAVGAACARLGVPEPRTLVLSVSPQEAMRQLASFDALVSVRLHGVILAALAARPCVPVIYDPKVAAAASTLAVDDLALPIGDVVADRVSRALEAVSHPSRQARVAARVDQLRAQESQARAAILEACR